MLLLVTYDFLDYMEKNVTWFASMLKSRKRKITSIVAVRLEVTADELEKTAGEDYDADKQWENFEVYRVQKLCFLSVYKKNLVGASSINAVKKEINFNNASFCLVKSEYS